MSATRTRVLRLVEDKRFQSAIIVLIVINAAILGLETSPRITADWGHILGPLNTFTIGVFVIEIVLRIYAHRGAFFKDGWSLFDFFVVAVALIPASGGSEVLRVLRILRVLRLLSTVKSMRRVVSALIATLPGMASIGALLLMMMYISSVMATQLFSDVAPEAFGSLPQSALTMFQIMTGDNWTVVVPTVTDEMPWAWLFFIGYILITTYIVLNLFIAVAVEALERQRDGDVDVVEAALDEALEDETYDNAQIMAAISHLQTEIERLHARLPDESA